MDDEAFKLPEMLNFDHPSTLQPGSVHPLPQPASDSIFGRFVQKIGMIFNRTQPPIDLNLNGRIRELKTIADTLLFELLDLKKQLQKIVEPELYSATLQLLDPLIKEAGKAPPMIERKDNTAKQVKVFSRYVDSIEKAKIWLAIGKMSNNKEALEQALIQQIANEFLARIDRDIRVVQDYLNHALSSLEMSEGLRNELKKKLIPGLSEKLLELYKLKKQPSDLSLKSFMAWRAHSDRDREIFFGAALHIIDSFSDEFLPCLPKERKNADLEEMEEKVHALEEHINIIAFEVGNKEQLNDLQRKNLYLSIERLESEAHQLNANLHLSYENSKKIETYLEVLSSLREDLSY